MGLRRKFSAEYKRDAVVMLQSPGVGVSQIAAELRMGVNVLGQWPRELDKERDQVLPGHGQPREEELALVRSELARITKEWDFLREAAAFFTRASR